VLAWLANGDPEKGAKFTGEHADHSDCAGWANFVAARRGVHAPPNAKIAPDESP
jgi:hypothetical protein